MDKEQIITRPFDESDDSIHKLAATILVSDYKRKFIFTQGKYSYQIMGGKGGYLYYKKIPSDNWIMIANWCFFGVYIVVRYRKPVWLRPMYETLFHKMHFTDIRFNDYNIDMVGSDGETLRSRRFRLSPPSSLETVMKDKFGYSDEKLKYLKAQLGLE